MRHAAAHAEHKDTGMGRKLPVSPLPSRHAKGVRTMTSEAFAAWLKEPLPTWSEPPCDTCGKPTAVTLTVDGKTLRACEAHVSELHA